MFVWLPRPVFKRTGDTLQSLPGRRWAPGPAPASSWPLALPLLGGEGQGSRRQWSAAVRCLNPGAGLLRQAQDCLDKRLGAAWLTVCPWGPDVWGVLTGMVWPEWGRGSARLIPGPCPPTLTESPQVCVCVCVMHFSEKKRKEKESCLFYKREQNNEAE